MTTQRLTARELVIQTILERFDELRDPLRGPGELRGDGNSVALMPVTYSADVREVERLYKLMRTTPGVYGEPAHPIVSLHWHLAEWYTRSTSLTVDVPVFGRRHGKKIQQRNQDGSPVTRRSLVVRRHPAAQEALALSGVAWMAHSWGLSREPFLPKEIAA